MVESTFDSGFVDRYVRGGLSEEEETDFEIALLDSPQLQAEVQTTLVICEILRLDEDSEQPGIGESPEFLKGKHNW